MRAISVCARVRKIGRFAQRCTNRKTEMLGNLVTVEGVGFVGLRRPVFTHEQTAIIGRFVGVSPLFRGGNRKTKRENRIWETRKEQAPGDSMQTVNAFKKVTTRVRPVGKQSIPPMPEVQTTHSGICPGCQRETRIRTGVHDAVIYGSCRHFAGVEQIGGVITVQFA